MALNISHKIINAVILTSLLGALSGCASVPKGQSYNSQKLLPTQKNTARVVVYQPKFSGFSVHH